MEVMQFTYFQQCGSQVRLARASSSILLAMQTQLLFPTMSLSRRCCRFRRWRSRTAWSASSWRCRASTTVANCLPQLQVLPVPAVEITYGLERILMAMQGVDHFKDIRYAPGVTYGELFLQNEVEMSAYNMNEADLDDLKLRFDLAQKVSSRPARVQL